MPLWKEHNWIPQTQILLDSYARFVKKELLDRGGPATNDAERAEQARRLFEAPFVVVSHGTQDDPILNYGNAAALELWRISIQDLLETPSRKTAEPMHRDERQRLLERTARDGFVDDYRGVRIATNGQRFLIERATVWNLVDETGERVGQAATFSEWTFLDD